MPVTLHDALDEYTIILEMGDLSPNTVRNQKASLTQFRNWAHKSSTFPAQDISQIKAKHLREFFHYRKTEQGIGAGARQQNYVHLNKFFKWVTQEYKKELRKNPLDKVARITYKPPLIEFPLEDIIDKMISTCDHTFKGTRDRLLLQLIKETGGRANEVLSLEEQDFHEVEQYIIIRYGKGGKQREVPYGDETSIALIAYKALRKDHHYAHLSAFFIGHKGAFGYSGLHDMFRDRSLWVNDAPLSPHKFRHAFVHKAKELGMSEDALMELLGWSTRTMLDLYGRSMRRERAHREYRKKLQGKSE